MTVTQKDRPQWLWEKPLQRTILAKKHTTCAMDLEKC